MSQRFARQIYPDLRLALVQSQSESGLFDCRVPTLDFAAFIARFKLSLLRSEQRR